MIRRTETERRAALITISSKVSVLATISLKTKRRTPLTGSKKGEEIFHLEIVHLAHLIFLSVRIWGRASVNDVGSFWFKRKILRTQFDHHLTALTRKWYQIGWQDFRVPVTPSNAGWLDCPPEINHSICRFRKFSKMTYITLKWQSPLVAGGFMTVSKCDYPELRTQPCRLLSCVPSCAL